MTKINCDSPIHKVSSLILAFIILSFCVFPSFAKADSVRPNEPIGYKDGDTFRDIVLAVLDSWGINFSKTRPDDDTSILEYGDQLLQEFYRENNTTQELFWDAVKYGANEVGNIILDFTGVNAIRNIANWLIDKFSLTDNSSVDVSQSSTGNFVQIPYYSGTNASGVYNNGRLYYFKNDGTPFRVTTTYNSAPVYCCWYTSDYPRAQGGGRVYFTTSPSVVALTYVANNKNFVFTQSRPLTERIGSFYCLVQGPGYSDDDYLSYNGVPVDFPVYSSLEEIYSVILNASSPVIINTDVINVPSDNDITPNDGIEISVPGTNWGDSIITILDIIERLIDLYDSTQLSVDTVIELISTLLQGLQQSVTVENIPGAVTLDYDDYDIPLENEWGLFDIFFDSGGDSGSVLSPWQGLRSIIFGFPAPILSFFALVVLFIVAYGFIRMGRDSH